MSEPVNECSGPIPTGYFFAGTLDPIGFTSAYTCLACISLVEGRMRYAHAVAHRDDGFFERLEVRAGGER